MKSGRAAIAFEIITDYTDEISKEIIRDTRHTTTLIPGRGMFSGRETGVLLCVVNKTQIAAVNRIIRNYPNTFAIVHPVSEIVGNFHKRNSAGKEVTEVLDAGDGKTL